MVSLQLRSIVKSRTLQKKFKIAGTLTCVQIISRMFLLLRKILDTLIPRTKTLRKPMFSYGTRFVAWLTAVRGANEHRQNFEPHWSNSNFQCRRQCRQPAQLYLATIIHFCVHQQHKYLWKELSVSGMFARSQRGRLGHKLLRQLIMAKCNN